MKLSAKSKLLKSAIVVDPTVIAQTFQTYIFNFFPNMNRIEPNMNFKIKPFFLHVVRSLVTF